MHTTASIHYYQYFLICSHLSHTHTAPTSNQCSTHAKTEKETPLKMTTSEESELSPFREEKFRRSSGKENMKDENTGKKTHGNVGKESSKDKEEEVKALIFGSPSIGSELKDSVSGIVMRAISESISALPLMAGAAGTDEASAPSTLDGGSTMDLAGYMKLVQSVRTTYDFHIDEWEEQVDRDIVSIPKRWRKQLIRDTREGTLPQQQSNKKEIAARLLSALGEESVPDTTPAAAEPSGKNTPLPNQSHEYSNIAKKDIPSDADMSRIDKELAECRKQISEAKLKKTKLETQKRELSESKVKLEKSSSRIKRALEETLLNGQGAVTTEAAREVTTNLRERVIAAVKGQHELRQLTSQSKVLTMQLEEISKKNGKDDNDTITVEFQNMQKAKTPSLTADPEAMTILRQNISLKDAANLSAALKKNK
jgi:hypothetical protein